MQDQPIDSGDEWPQQGRGRTTLTYEPRLDAQSARLELVRILRRSGSPDEETVLWSRRYAHRRHAEAIFAWMTSRQEQWAVWGRLTPLVGPDGLLAAAGQAVAEERRGTAHKLLRKREKARKAREKAKHVHSYLVDDRGEFGIDLRRGGQEDGFFVIWFRQQWERERFRDWWRPQVGRFPEFAAFFEQHGAKALERRLLKEMQETERRVRLAGLSAGGRRPLRFWRGDD